MIDTTNRSPRSSTRARRLALLLPLALALLAATLALTDPQPPAGAAGPPGATPQPVGDLGFCVRPPGSAAARPRCLPHRPPTLPGPDML